jgi:tetratricopeptide (TPR) repeat protein
MRLAITLILFINAFCLRAQDIEETFKLGHKLYQEGNFSAAEEVLKRVLFFDKDDNYGPKVNLVYANSLYKAGKYNEANYYYDLAYFSADELVKNDILLQKTSCYLLLQNYSYARVELFNLTEGLTIDQSKLKVFYTALLEFAEGNYLASQSAFNHIVEDSLAISELFIKNKKIDKLKPKTAKVLSIILPGLGQIYAGDWKSGINSLILTGGLLYLGVNSGIKNSFLDAAIGVLPWFQRYYTGGFKRAEKIAEAKILERRHAVFNEILELVEQ